METAMTRLERRRKLAGWRKKKEIPEPELEAVKEEGVE
jgi:hypothetical protein